MKKISPLLSAVCLTLSHTVPIYAGMDEGNIPRKHSVKSPTHLLIKDEQPKVAFKVPGKVGWIKSPYDGRVLDASGFESGALVRDPVSSKVMRVP